MNITTSHRRFGRAGRRPLRRGGTIINGSSGDISTGEYELGPDAGAVVDVDGGAGARAYDRSSLLSIEHPWVTKSVENAQHKVEQRNFDIRKNLRVRRRAGPE